MAQARSSESSTTSTDRTDGTETQAPAGGAFVDTPGQALPKDGAGNWGVAARWMMFAMIAIAFFVCLYVLF